MEVPEVPDEKLLRLNRLYAVLRGTNQVIVHAVDRNDLFREVCRVAVERGDFRMAWIGIVDEESGLLKPAAWYGNNDGYLDNVCISVREEMGGFEPAGNAIREENLAICNDFASDQRPVYRCGEAERRGFLSSAAIALKSGGKTIGALTLYAGEKDFFRWQFTELLHQIAVDISFALDNFDREARRREAEQALKEETAERLRTLEALHEKDQLLMQQSRLAAMGEIINYIAHQWRQPLNSISLLVHLLKDARLKGECRCEHVDHTVEQISHVILHMAQTIDDFRDFFKTGKEMERFSVKEVTCKTLTFIADSLRANRIKITVETQDDVLVAGYPNEYSQALLNILNNAREVLVERNIESPTVSIRQFREGERAVITIADNAGGIPASIISRIFESYFTTRENGTGIGLYMTKTIIEKRMNGRIAVKNADEGAEFRIELFCSQV